MWSLLVPEKKKAHLSLMQCIAQQEGSPAVDGEPTVKGRAQIWLYQVRLPFTCSKTFLWSKRGGQCVQFLVRVSIVSLPSWAASLIGTGILGGSGPGVPLWSKPTWIPYELRPATLSPMTSAVWHFEHLEFVLIRCGRIGRCRHMTVSFP